MALFFLIHSYFYFISFSVFLILDLLHYLVGQWYQCLLVVLLSMHLTPPTLYSGHCCSRHCRHHTTPGCKIARNSSSSDCGHHRWLSTVRIIYVQGEEATVFLLCFTVVFYDDTIRVENIHWSLFPTLMLCLCLWPFQSRISFSLTIVKRCLTKLVKHHRVDPARNKDYIWQKGKLLQFQTDSWWYTVLGVKISHGHDYTSCATLGHFEMEFWGGTCRYYTWAQCWVQRFIVVAAQVIRRYALPCKTLSSGPKVARFCEGVKKVWQRAKEWLLDKYTKRFTDSQQMSASAPIQSQVRSGLLRLLCLLWSVVGILAVLIVLRSSERRQTRSQPFRLPLE